MDCEATFAKITANPIAKAPPKNATGLATKPIAAIDSPIPMIASTKTKPVLFAKRGYAESKVDAAKTPPD